MSALSSRLGPSDPLPTRYCVVGAGASGLIAARALLRYGIDVDVLERDPNIGGIWNNDHPSSPVYESCNFISDRTHSGFIGFRMPASLPDYPTWRDVRDYITQFADRAGLAAHVTCNTEVVSATPVEHPDGIYWQVGLSTASTRHYRGVVWACGQQQYPHLPAVPGSETFTGRLIHSCEYKRGTEFLDKRVLVIGAGNSGVDIVCDASAFASHAMLSMRRGYWFLPKRLFGQGLASFLDRSATMPPGFPPLDSMSTEEIWTMVLSTMGPPEAVGLPAPDHPFGATHPVVNEQVMYNIAHGKLHPKPDVLRIDGDRVVFADGTSESVDVIVCATGYTVRIPWLDPAMLDWNGPEPDFHLGTIARRVPGLYAVGLLHFPGHTYALWDQLAQLAAADAHATLTGENADNLRALKVGYDPDLTGGQPLLRVHRNLRQADTPALMAVLEELRVTYKIPIPERWDETFYPELTEAAASVGDVS
jgi:cation diffusion facilitator CzcD-associated flavoprotein CzcO